MSADDRTEMLPALRAEDTPQRAADPGGEAASRGGARRPRRKWLVSAAVVAVLAATVGGVAYTWTRTDSGGPSASGPAGGQTATVTRTDLSVQKSMPGTLGFDAPHTVKGHGTGTITWLPKEGATLDRGGQLARVDDRPVTVFRGDMPLYRTLGAPLPSADDAGAGKGASGNPSAPEPGTARKPGKVGESGAADQPEDAEGKPGGTAKPAADQAAPTAGEGSSRDGGTAATGTGGGEVAGPGTTGADVKLLEENLYALGYHDFGRPDDKLTEATVTAIKRWQKSLGDKHPTGRVAPGDVEVLPGTVRVGEVKAHLGDSAAEDLMVLTGTDQVVSVPVPVSDLTLARKGSQVTITLPDGKTTKGTVGSVGTVATGSGGQSGSGGDQGGSGDGQGGSGQEAKVRVTLRLDDASAASGLTGAAVTADFASESHKGVLAVPVGALVALREGGYALQVPAAGDQGAGGKPQLVPVKTGMFTKGLVEVSGAGVKEGMKVVSTA
ncbi:peptidoglycan-binding protein [Streptomyces sp. x-19]|uniref:peptidoglycan-binding protein n=1 Tax=Streptomyces sp. x-19 TaxID=2789280 RepID=UPI003981476D